MVILILIMILIFYKDSTMTHSDQINSAISQATIDGNFNSDLISDLNLRKLAIQEYINRTCENDPDSELAPYVAPVNPSLLNSVYAVHYTLESTGTVIEKRFKFSSDRDSFVKSLFDNPNVIDIKLLTLDN